MRKTRFSKYLKMNQQRPNNEPTTSEQLAGISAQELDINGESYVVVRKEFSRKLAEYFKKNR